MYNKVYTKCQNQACKEKLCLEQPVTNSVDIAILSVQFSDTEIVNKPNYGING